MNKKSILLNHFTDSHLVQYAAQQHHIHQRQPVVFVCQDTKTAQKAFDDFSFFTPKSKIEILLPHDVLPYYGLSPHPDIILQKQKVLYQLLKQEIDILIIPLKALIRYTTPKSFFEKNILLFKTGDLVDRQDLRNHLILIGYEHTSIIEEKGQFSIRGDIIDIFSPQMEQPTRLNLFDIEIESVKIFDINSQRTLQQVSELIVIPVKEIPFTALTDQKLNDEFFNTNWSSLLKKRADQKNIAKYKRDHVEELISNKIYFHGHESFLSLFYKNKSTLFDFFPKNTSIFISLNEHLQTTLDTFYNELLKQQQASDHIESIIAPEEIFICRAEVESLLKNFNLFQHHLNHLPTDETQTAKGQSNFDIKNKIQSKVAQVHSLLPLVSELNQKRREGFHCVIVCKNSLQVMRVKDLLQRFELPLSILDSAQEHDFIHINPSKTVDHLLVHLVEGSLHEGFLDEIHQYWWITDEEIFGKKTRRARSQSQKTTVFNSFSELNEGDYIIHLDYGIGLYKGLVKLDFDINKNDFLLIEYLNQDKIYVPINKLNRVQRFTAQEGSAPQLDKLGSDTWIKTRNKAKKAAKQLAGELLKLQAKRHALERPAFDDNKDLNEEFAASFEFEETLDQSQVIGEVMQDMESLRPMDRLICGDVGFGKTEIAMRAAFKATSHQKQVAVLVPTTVLAFQHYQTFKKRFKNYPVHIELLSRFKSQKEQQEIVNKIKNNQVDIVIATHRILSQDIKFSALGLLIVDEEHRFGVVHKEKIKKLKNMVDVLTLTATPIPRTLNFALNGIRDLSVINTPPHDRLAIKTYTSYFEEATIKDAIQKELRRGGQIYFLHNKVQTIENMCEKIKAIVPEARVRFAHGQMNEDDLENIMIDFMNHDFDILVCTTIIESGLDIPNANTIIINRADHLGLSQLYQLRGRVGRSHQQAYCYLIIPPEELLTGKARKRLAVIQRFTELGSGFKISSYDLEIRGAGNILGDDQSGHIAAIGYDLYIQMLENAIKELNHQHIPEDFEPEIQLQIPTKIPESFIEDTHLRLNLYKQISSANTLEDADQTHEEWVDRFGQLPDEMQSLIQLIKIRILCKTILVADLKQSGQKILVNFHSSHQVDTSLLSEAIKNNPKKFSLTPDGRFVITQAFPSHYDCLIYLIQFLEKLKLSLPEFNAG